MWIKRKSEYEHMKNSIINLKEKVKDLENLTFTMRTIINMLIKIHGGGGTLYENRKGIANLSVNHNIQTEKFSDVTLEELAKYVIDGESIIR